MKKLQEQLEKYGDWALVAGASEGLGKAFAETLAATGKNVILIARRADALQEVSDYLQGHYGVETRIGTMDLADNNAFEHVMELIEDTGCRLVVYNAAYGPVKMFVDNTEDELDTYLDLNARTLIKLAWAFARKYQGNKSAGFLIMSSMAGMRGTLMVAPYGATKAFDFNLGEALYHEFRDSNIDFSVLCAGPIKTPNYLSTKPTYSWVKPKEHEPRFVAEEGLRLLGRKALGLPGSSNRINDIILSRIMPRSSAVKLANDTMRKIYSHFWKG